MGKSNQLHSYTTPQPSTTVNRIHMFVHAVPMLALLYYRLSRLFLFNAAAVPLLPWSLVTFAEFLLAVTWTLQQPFRWRPVIRDILADPVPIPDADLPAIDVFVVTADPGKEPTVDVMNTVISAMTLDYPTEKLAVYLSDDGGVALTLFAVRGACAFARHWVPFCRKYRLKTICPKAYFSKMADDERLLRSTDEEFKQDQDHLKSLYEEFKKSVEHAREQGDVKDCVVSDRLAYVEVIHDYKMDSKNSDDQNKLPLLVYVSRERRPSHPHRFKGGALNALLRVSGLMSNAPYFLMLDCDMFCNEPTSARRAMCFHLDPNMSHTLAFVQYPQIFHNLGKDDIYDAQGRTTYKAQFHGLDGLRGPMLSGTGVFIKRKALFGTPSKNGEKAEEEFFHEQENDRNLLSSEAMVDKAKTLTSVDFHNQIGFSYGSMLESSFTGYLLQCRGWTSVYYYSKRPAFLGCAPSDLKDASTQLLKWMSGLLLIGLSRCNPITYGMSKMSVLQSMCYAYFMYIALYTVALLIYGTVPQLCFFSAVPLYPKVSDPWFWVFAFTCISSVFEHLYEVLSTGGTTRMWWNEYRIWMIQSVTGVLFGSLDAFTKLLGMGKATFRLSNKVIDEEKLKRSKKGKFDFQGAGMFVIPLSILITLNTVCFVGGVKRMVAEMNFEEMFGQFVLSSHLLYVSYSIIEGIITMKR
ncbi:cellulose synthase like E1 [Actinidia rufa]|uniref:Cellulose synthase like E1 n=1 Tax=Actinidia rufa TaxID=165716 RepID=A0A7J0GNI8_9ERIC|nr:cellulose synthase like E1 [Actinidia rufa]